MKGPAALLSVLFCAGFLFAQTPEILIQELTGTVEVKEPGSSRWIPAREGMRLEQLSIISTGLQSSAVILIGQSKIMVRPLTRLSIEELSALRENEQVGLFLRTGKVRAEVTPPEGGRTNFTVRSTQATNSVRGTVFEFDTVQVKVEEGRVFFLPNAGGSAALVRAGESSAYIEAAVLASPRRVIIDTVRPELPPGLENGAAMPESAISLPAVSLSAVSPPPLTPSPDVDTHITITW
ncbi:MAG: FecR domain-containing protein [Treponema sp.]|jgi:hypothetical protein|nr:FecR domain-containing protein [Treponema sp.]